jgi:hypothetical protein
LGDAPTGIATATGAGGASGGATATGVAARCAHPASKTIGTISTRNKRAIRISITAPGKPEECGDDG